LAEGFLKRAKDRRRGAECPALRRCMMRRWAISPGAGQNQENKMPQAAIFPPFFTVILLTMVVWFYMYARRIPFIMGGNFKREQLTPLEFARISPPQVANPSDNLKNLFEIPTLFYALVLYLYVTNQVDSIFVAAAWVFAVFRVLHSAVHCTINVILIRFWLYFVSAAALWFIAIRVVLHR
jgi:hypothetical protein